MLIKIKRESHSGVFRKNNSNPKAEIEKLIEQTINSV